MVIKVSISTLVVGFLIAGVQAMAAQPPSPEVVRADAKRVHRAALGHIRDFACVQTPSDGDQLRLVLMVTSSRARPRAKRLIRGLRSSSVASVRVISKRFRRSTMRVIYRRVKASVPAEDAERITLSFPEGPSDHFRSRCRQIYITYPSDAVQAETARWVESVQERYGSDRIGLIKLVTPVAGPAPDQG